MGTPQKFLLPSPNFNKKAQTPPMARPHFLTPSGMTLHARHQPPPMYGKRGATYPGKFLKGKHNSSATYVTPPATETVDINESQYCEACDMELQSMDDLRGHKAQHEKCPIDNCNYRGHPSVMDKHVTNLHNSGLFDKFKKLSTPEEIAAWREERKRKYPTVENTLLRQRAKEQREKRGERLEGNTSRFGRYADRKRAQDNTQRSSRLQTEKQNQNRRHQKNNIHNKHPNNKRRKKEEQQKLEEKKLNEKIAQINTEKQDSDSDIVMQHKEEVERSCDGVYMFKGTGTLVGYEHLKSKKVKETNLLSTLLGMYGSDEDSEIDVSGNEENENGDDDDTIDSLDIKPDNDLNSLLKGAEHSGATRQVNDATTKEVEFASGSKQEISFKEESSYATTLNFADTKASSSKPAEAQENLNQETAKEDISDHKMNSKEMNELTESDHEPPEEAPIARSSDIPMPTERTQPNKGSEASTSEPAPATKRAKTDQHVRCRRTKYGLDYRKARVRKQNTLLEKLLEPDIRHERNVLLQCVRYVCENKFFGIGEENKD